MNARQVYRWMLNAYPQQFRERFGEEMEWVFTETLRDAQTEPGGALRVWVRVIVDVTVTAIQEHWTQGDFPMDTNAFEQQLPSTLHYWSRAMRQGYSVKQVMSMIAERAPEPTASAFHEALNEVEQGKDWVQVFAEFASRVPTSPVKAMVAAMRQQMTEGGNFADRLDGVRAEIPAAGNGWSDSLDIATE